MSSKLVLIGLLLVLFSTQAYALSDTNLVAYYNFDETSGTTLIDVKGYDQNGVNTKATINQTGKIGKAYLFDGATSKIVTTASATINPSSFTYSLWVKPSANPTSGDTFNLGGTIPITQDSGFRTAYYNSSGTYELIFVKNSPEVYKECVLTGPLSTTNWSYLVFSIGANGMKVYLNGLNICTYATETSYTTATKSLYIGADPRQGGTVNNGWYGLIDEISLWNKQLSQMEINELYNSGNGITYPFDNASFSYLANPEEGKVYLYDTSYIGEGITDWNWLVDGLSISTDQNTSFAATEFTDYNVCLIINDGNFFTCQTINSGEFYGDITFNIYNEATGALLNDSNISVTPDINGVSNWILTDTNTLTIDLTGITTGTYTFALTKTGYSTRYYTTDLTQYTKLDVNFALIVDTNDSDILFKVYETDETTIYANTFVELKDRDTNRTIGKLKTNATGEATFNLRTDDSNYWTIVNNGAYTYSPVTLTILYPKDEETLAQITEKWKIEISQNLYAYYPDLNTTKIVYLLPNTALPYNIKIGDMNGNYFQRTYSKLYPGNPLTDTLQPYLVKTTTGLLTTITTKNAITNTNISGITIKIYKFISGQGRTFVEQVTTDNKGQAISLLVLGAEYEFECYSGATFIKTYTITATSSTIFIYLQPTTETTTETPETSPSGFAVKYTPTYSGLNKLNVGTQVFTQTAFNNYGVSVTYTSQIIQGGILSSQSYTGSDANKTFSHTINWVDINNNVPVVSRLTITYGGKNYVYQTNYIINDSFGTNYNLLEGLSTGLRSDAGCEATGICFPLMTIALLLSIGLTIWVAISMGPLGQQTAGIVLLLAMVVFTYLSWIPFELTVACVLILLAFVVNERRN